MLNFYSLEFKWKFFNFSTGQFSFRCQTTGQVTKSDGGFEASWEIQNSEKFHFDSVVSYTTGRFGDFYINLDEQEIEKMVIHLYTHLHMYLQIPLNYHHLCKLESIHQSSQQHQLLYLLMWIFLLIPIIPV